MVDEMTSSARVGTMASTSKHQWALDIVVREFEFRDGRWVVISKRVIAANPDERYR